MKLYHSVKKVIARKLGFTVEELSAMSAETIDEHIAKNIVHKPLPIGRVGDRLVPDRGSIFQSVAKEKLDRKIDTLMDYRI